ncbi:hypothetical protein PITCH_A880018 [uncultured Desulfobacterium sp.]|uniref:Uncharacterized protein n=1 Tax=uncultured Desulfobacterium sp. TaxID=201089 RepID=A0A445N3L9_9BACT|nr:hypothetical protein PITCH_A880018 [uncultured Desulfobacterium sp.]
MGCYIAVPAAKAQETLDLSG